MIARLNTEMHARIIKRTKVNREIKGNNVIEVKGLKPELEILKPQEVVVDDFKDEFGGKINRGRISYMSYLRKAGIKLSDGMASVHGLNRLKNK